jgi:hypothetical protein
VCDFEHSVRNRRIPESLTAGFVIIERGETFMLYTILGILLVLWLLGFSMHIGGNVIHALLVIAVVVFLVNLITGRRAV